MNTSKRLLRVRKYMKQGMGPTKIAEILGEDQQTINEDILWLNRRALQLGLQLGDWVEVKRDSPITLPCDGKLGRIMQICLSAGEVGVDLRPLSDTPWEQLFDIYDVHKLNEMEVLAMVAR